MSALTDLMGVLLPGGVAAGAVLLIQAWRSWREGKQSREETAIQRWQRLATEADDQRAIAENDEAYAILLADHWRQRTADLEYVMRLKGVPIPPPRPVPKKQQIRRRQPRVQARRNRAIRDTADTAVEEDLE